MRLLSKNWQVALCFRQAGKLIMSRGREVSDTMAGTPAEREILTFHKSDSTLAAHEF